MSFTVKSKKWYGRFWPPERRKIKLMQALVDYQAPEIEKKMQKAWTDNLLYGAPLPGEAGWDGSPTGAEGTPDPAKATPKQEKEITNG